MRHLGNSADAGGRNGNKTMGQVRNYFNQVEQLLRDVNEREVETCVDLLWECYERGGRVITCGNGGSASTASHFVTDLQKNLFSHDPPLRPFEALSLVDSVPLLTAWSNDTEYANVFAAQARCWLRPGDILLSISGSGNSPNVVAAAEVARSVGATAMSWCGYGGGKLAKLSQCAVVLESRDMQQVEDIHLVLAHVIFRCLHQKMMAIAAGLLPAATESHAEAATLQRNGIHPAPKLFSKHD